MTESEEQIKLIEELGLQLEDNIKLSPLASRIYSLLILSSNEGLTFEEIQTIVPASKSSISVNVNVLLQLDYISFYTKSGTRKRYFRLAKYFSLVTLNVDLQDISNEVRLIDKINTYNKKYHSAKYTNENSLGDILQDYLIKKQTLIQDTIKKIDDFSATDKEK
ncbi:MarR family transcriptional regulator [Flavobacterium sp. PL12]|uniref:GbsR/MarR family transcriptional regulator n=1 Tax=Flavobacterium sp. PL12 TaxID=3071718 RepID=UPI00319DF8E2